MIARSVGRNAIVCHFEVTDLAGSRDVLRHMGLSEAAIYQRTTDDAHLAQIESVLPGLADADVDFVLAGKGASAQRIRQALKQCAVPAVRIAKKAAWVPGKAGLD